MSKKTLVIECFHLLFLGIVSMMTKLTTLLSKQDLELYQQLTLTQSIKPHYYAFRWLTLLLSQEFPLPGNFKHISLYKFCFFHLESLLIYIEKGFLFCNFFFILTQFL